MLNLVPLFTVAFVYVARYPLFQQWLDALERFLLRHLLPGSGAVVREYLTEFAAKAAGLQGLGIAFVVVTAVLLVATVEQEINAIWGVRERRSLLHRGFVYALGLTAGPLAIGAAIYATTWLLEVSVEQAPFVTPAVALLATPLAIAITTRSYSRCSTRCCPRAACRSGPRSGAGSSPRSRFEVAKYGFRLYVTSMSELPDDLRLAGRRAALPALGLRLVVRGPGRRRGDGDAGRRPARRARRARGVSRWRALRLRIGRGHATLPAVFDGRTSAPCGPSFKPPAGRSGR